MWSRGREKIVVSVRNKESFFANNFLKKWYVKWSYLRSDLIVAISERVKYDIVNRFGIAEEKVKVIYNPAPEIRLTGKVEEEFARICETKRVIINAGRLTEQKGQRHLVKAFYKVVEEVTDVHLVILGTGELETELKQLAIDLDIADKVYFAGFVYNPYDYISKSELFVFSSIVEGLGNILIETMACGVPIISTDCDCGPRELLAPGTDISKSTDEIEYGEYGILVPVCNRVENDTNKQSISDKELMLGVAIVELLQNQASKKEYKRKATEHTKDFMIDKIARQWDSII